MNGKYTRKWFESNSRLFHEGKTEEEIADILKYTQDNDDLIRF